MGVLINILMTMKMDTIRLPVSAKWTCFLLLIMAAAVRSDLTAEFLGQSPASAHLLLTCSTEDLPRGAHVISITIHDGSAARASDPLALLTQRESVPMFGNASQDVGKRFVSGALHNSDAQASSLRLLLLNHQMTEAGTFSCKVLYLAGEEKDGKVKNRQYEKRVEMPQPLVPDHAVEDKEDSTPAPKPTTKKPEVELEPTLRTGNSVQQPTVLQTGIPMEVLIVMLVLITLLVVVVAALLLQKLRRCRAQPVAYPHPHYAFPGDMAWDERFGGLKGSRPSIHTTVGLRSHYSLPRPLQPPPPPPKLHRSVSKDSADYAERSCMTPAGMTRSFHYTTPYDAIVQDEDGELSLLNTSAHCDITPALPPELAEPTYKTPRTPRVEAEVQTQGQGHSMYARGTAFNTPGLDLQ